MTGASGACGASTLAALPPSAVLMGVPSMVEGAAAAAVAAPSSPPQSMPSQGTLLQSMERREAPRVRSLMEAHLDGGTKTAAARWAAH